MYFKLLFCSSRRSPRRTTSRRPSEPSSRSIAAKRRRYGRRREMGSRTDVLNNCVFVQGDILLFLTGQEEIEEACKKIKRQVIFEGILWSSDWGFTVCTHSRALLCQWSWIVKLAIVNLPWICYELRFFVQLDGVIVWFVSQRLVKSSTFACFGNCQVDGYIILMILPSDRRSRSRRGWIEMYSSLLDPPSCSTTENLRSCTSQQAQWSHRFVFLFIWWWRTTYHW